MSHYKFFFLRGTLIYLVLLISPLLIIFIVIIFIFYHWWSSLINWVTGGIWSSLAKFISAPTRFNAGIYCHQQTQKLVIKTCIRLQPPRWFGIQRIESKGRASHIYFLKSLIKYELCWWYILIRMYKIHSIHPKVRCCPSVMDEVYLIWMMGNISALIMMYKKHFS